MAPDDPRWANLAKGRKPKGENKSTRDVRAMAMQALSEVGGVDYLVKQAEENPKVFLTLVAKCMPKDHHHHIQIGGVPLAEALVARRRKLQQAEEALRLSGKVIDAEVING